MLSSPKKGEGFLCCIVEKMRRADKNILQLSGSLGIMAATERSGNFDLTESSQPYPVL